MEKLMKRKIFLYTILGLMLFLLPHNTRGAELVTNGSFESGMTGWTVVNATNPWIPWQSVTAGFDNGFNAPASPQVGTRDAYQGVTGDPGTRFITQDFTIPAGSTASLQWRHRFQFDNATFCDGANCGTGLFTVDILNTSNLLLANLYTRNVASEQIVDTGWQNFQRNISAFAGLTIRLRFRTTVTANLSGPGQLEIDGVSAQSPAIIPTAANVTLGGRVATSEGVGVSRAQVTLTDGAGNPRTVLTNPFGYYNFDGVTSGATYILTVKSKQYLFADSPRAVTVQDNIKDVDFIASP
jgi:hypothetical protein